ncbi:hypothetical protein BC831DRAFT_389972, partial [Entophlyctis helioformis]
GLELLLDFVSPLEEQQLVHAIDAQPWSGHGRPPNPELRRRTQQYGFLFSFRSRLVEQRLGDLPDFVSAVSDRLRAHGIFGDGPPNHMLVNEYDLGQGIMPHVDSMAFGPVVTSLSLLTPCIMTFTDTATAESVPVHLPPRSLLVMQGHARYGMTHCISKETVETAGDVVIERGRRVSLTFRRIVESALP